MTQSELIHLLQHGRHIRCDNVEQRLQSLLLLQRLGFKISLTTSNYLVDMHDNAEYLNPGFDGKKICCWSHGFPNDIRFADIEYLCFDKEPDFQFESIGSLEDLLA